jgi:hypothetical protein
MENPAEDKAAPKTAEEPKSFRELLKAMLGGVVTMVNPESYEEMPVGHQIKPGFYRAKLLALADDYLVVISEFQHAGKGARKEAREAVHPPLRHQARQHDEAGAADPHLIRSDPGEPRATRLPVSLSPHPGGRHASTRPRRPPRRPALPGARPGRGRGEARGDAGIVR